MKDAKDGVEPEDYRAALRDCEIAIFLSDTEVEGEIGIVVSRKNVELMQIIDELAFYAQGGGIARNALGRNEKQLSEVIVASLRASQKLRRNHQSEAKILAEEIMQKDEHRKASLISDAEEEEGQTFITISKGSFECEGSNFWIIEERETMEEGVAAENHPPDRVGIISISDHGNIELSPCLQTPGRDTGTWKIEINNERMQAKTEITSTYNRLLEDTDGRHDQIRDES